MTTHKAVAAAVASLGLMLAGFTPAFAMEKARSTVANVPAGGYLYCKVTVDNAYPVDLSVTLLDANGLPVDTEFGSGFVASPEATGTGRYHSEATAGAFNDSASAVIGSCKARADGRFERGVDPQIEACGCTADSCPCAE